MTKASQTAKSARQSAEGLAELPQKALEAAQEYATDVYEEATAWAGDQTTEVCDTLKEYIAKNPYRAAGIALGIGCALGIMIARRKGR